MNYTTLLIIVIFILGFVVTIFHKPLLALVKTPEVKEIITDKKPIEEESKAYEL